MPFTLAANAQGGDVPVLPTHRLVTAQKNKTKTRSTGGTAGTGGAGRQVNFQRRGFKVACLQYLAAIKKSLWHASTPTDPLNRPYSPGAKTDESTSIVSATRMKYNEDDHDWFLNEVVVTGEDYDLELDADDGAPSYSGIGAAGDRRTESGHHDIPSNTSKSLYTPIDEMTGWDRVNPLYWLLLLRHIVYPEIKYFFYPRFADDKTETEYQKEYWYTMKKPLFLGSLYLVINWALYLWLNHSHTLYEMITYYGPFTLFTLPLPAMVALDMPRSPSPFRRITFQVWLALAAWYCGVTEVIEMKECGFFTLPKDANHCFGKDFLAMYFYCTAVPTLFMFMVSERIYNAIMQLAVFLLLCILHLRDEPIFTRTVVSFAIYCFFIQGLHYSRELAERRIYELRESTVLMFRDLTRARAREMKASEAKKKFSSYIFHECRVPLNTAVLAFQNLRLAGGLAAAEKTDARIEVYALESSLNITTQVLNDVLDLQKMEAGNFKNDRRAFPLHKAVKSALGLISVQTSSKNLELKIELDDRIDGALPLPHNFSSSPDNEKAGANGYGYGGGRSPEGLWVYGDDLRLHQILGNLCSNAVKFTSKGGIRVSTQLLWPPPNYNPSSLSADDNINERGNGNGKTKSSGGSQMSSGSRVNNGSGGRNNAYGYGLTEQELDSNPLLRRAAEVTSQQGRSVVCWRLEVEDTGPGIRPSDLIESPLFQPFVQTSIGKNSGTGSGLGLAIVKSICKRTGSRLGVYSRKGKGATFWIEMMYPVATDEQIHNARVATGAWTSTGSGGASKSGLALPFASPGSTSTVDALSLAATVRGSMANVYPSPADSSMEDPIASVGRSGAVEARDFGSNPGSGGGYVPPVGNAVTGRSGADTPTGPGTGLAMTNGEVSPPGTPTIMGAPPPMPSGTPPVLNSVEAPPMMPSVVEPSASGSSAGGGAGAGAGDGKKEEAAMDVLNVLIVDDDLLSRQLLSRRFQLLGGCRVETCDDGAQCLERVLGPRPDGKEMVPYDLICLDNMMEIMSGEEAVRRMRAQHRKEFVVGITGNALIEDQNSFLKAGADLVLTKPVKQSKKFVDIIEKARKLKAARKEELAHPSAPPEKGSVRTHL